MADVSRLMKMARKHSKEDKAASQARFKEILAIVKKYDIKDGLTPDFFEPIFGGIELGLIEGDVSPARASLL